MRLLVAYAAQSTHVPTTRSYLESFAKHSSFDVHYINVVGDPDASYDLSSFDIVLQSYCARWQIENYINPDFIEALDRFEGVKMLAVQDEYERTDRIKDAIEHLAYDVVFTCVPREYIEIIYPPPRFIGTEFVPVLTGYAEARPEGAWLPVNRLAERPIHVGYRGRELFVGRYGRLAFEKVKIGRDMRRECEARNVPCDIAWDERSRLYGDAWFRWLARCRSVLGTESGSNVFDFGDGAVNLEPFGVNMAQISPRVFEAAATRTPMILYEGEYSGIIQPWTHYIPLAKDLSNVDYVFEVLRDIERLAKLAERAYDTLIASGRYSYETFVRRVEQAALAHLASKTRRAAPLACSRSLHATTRRPLGVVHAHFRRLQHDRLSRHAGERYRDL